MGKIIADYWVLISVVAVGLSLFFFWEQIIKTAKSSFKSTTTSTPTTPAPPAPVVRGSAWGAIYLGSFIRLLTTVMAFALILWMVSIFLPGVWEKFPSGEKLWLIGAFLVLGLIIREFFSHELSFVIFLILALAILHDSGNWNLLGKWWAGGKPKLETPSTYYAPAPTSVKVPKPEKVSTFYWFAKHGDKVRVLLSCEHGCWRMLPKESPGDKKPGTAKLVIEDENGDFVMYDWAGKPPTHKRFKNGYYYLRPAIGKELNPGQKPADGVEVESYILN